MNVHGYVTAVYCSFNPFFVSTKLNKYIYTYTHTTHIYMDLTYSEAALLIKLNARLAMVLSTA